MHEYSKIYKRTSSGKVQVWYMERDGEKYRTVSGQLDGKLVKSAWTVAKAKNIGKANETTPVEQALSEIDSKYEKKLTREYHKSVDDIDKKRYIKPMKAVNFEDIELDWDRPHVIQPKLDGIRCVIDRFGMKSREGKPIAGAPHIFSSLTNYFKSNPDAVLDGELYNHDLKNDFEQIVSVVRREKHTKETLEKSKKIVQYHIYDFVNENTYDKRYSMLQGVCDFSLYTRLVPSYTVESFDDIQRKHEYFVGLGYEGSMIRVLDSLYEYKRSKNLIKFKDFQDAEFTILDILEGEGNNSGMAAKIHCRTADDQNFYPNMKGSFEFCRQVLAEKHKYIGGEATINYFGLTKYGVPRFPRVKKLYRGGRDL